MPLPFISARYPIPTISSSRVQPLVTPSTALFTRARARPCTAACESFSRTATRVPSLCSTLIPPGSAVSNFPLGPCTATLSPSILTVTPWGIGIGFFPIRDIRSALAPGLLAATLLPDFAQQFAAYPFAPGLASRHHAPRRGKDVDPHASKHAGNLCAAHIDAASRPRYPLGLRDGSLIVSAILQVNPDHLMTLFLSRFEVGDEPLFLQDAGNLPLQPGRRNTHYLLAGVARIPHPRKPVSGPIGQSHRLRLLARAG